MPVGIEQEQHNVGRIIFNQQNFEFFCHNPNTGPVEGRQGVIAVCLPTFLVKITLAPWENEGRPRSETRLCPDLRSRHAEA